MPLSPSSARQPIHTRRITCQGYRRDDGLWDIEGHLIDTKSYDVPQRLAGGFITAGTPIHGMWLRVTVDDGLVIQQVESIIDDAPFPPCSGIAPVFASLTGLSLAAGFMREVRQRFAGVLGCTHMVELIGSVATAAFQTIYPILSREMGERGRPQVIDSCHALAADGAVVAQAWPAYATGSAQPDGPAKD
jgi:hypothetical protein